MQEWTHAQKLLEKQLVQFLGTKLPLLGGNDWWATHVFAFLTPPQQRVVSESPSPTLGKLDFAALLRVCLQNWYELANKDRSNLRRNTRQIIFQLIDFRNSLAHQSVDSEPPALDDYLHAIETVKRLIAALSGDAATLELVTKLARRVRQLAEREETEPSEESNVDTEVKPHTEPAPPREPSTWLLNPGPVATGVRTLLAGRTYVGIDFGTSTTVVSVLAPDEDGRLVSRGIPLDQPGENGEVIRHHLVNTVLAKAGNRVLFGHDAYRLRQRKFEGINVFSSFKMRLGVNIGPCYPESQLNGEDDTPKVTTAQEAAAVFFGLLRSSIREALRRESLPVDIAFAVTVPASFEANQRRDLLHAMSAAGLRVEDSCLIDEPNAAFLSFLLASTRGSGDKALLARLRDGTANVLVYDFGAGTCDVSILEVSVKNAAVSSRNRAISRFTALGGDDVDREIAKKVLMPQLLRSAPGFEPSERDREDRLVPWLVPTAERLKIAAIERAALEGVTTLSKLRESDVRIREKPVAQFTIRDKVLQLPEPTLSLAEFADCLALFTGHYQPDQPGMHVFAPAADALSKASLHASELDAVLFIGGSAANPFVQSAVMGCLPNTVAKIVPQDLRSHVSQGAAIHSFGHHAMHMELIRPITSEPIFVVTRGGGLETVVPAGTELPSAGSHVTELVVERHGQQVLELPMCVSNDSKLLGLVRLDAPSASGFARGTAVRLSTRITREKILEISATAGAAHLETVLLNPLSNTELTPRQAAMLEARQSFNLSLLANRGRPTPEVVIAYARAAGEAGSHETAADMYVQAERLAPKENFATSICYHYSRAGKSRLSAEWAAIAAKRDRNPVTIYNLSCSKTGEEREKLLEEASSGSDPSIRALLVLGRMKKSRGQPEGVTLLERALSYLEREMDEYTISKDECEMLVEAAELLMKKTTVERARDRLEQLSGRRPAYNAENLAASVESALEGSM